MTVTISRLYDSYAQATEAVSNLEKAGVPHSDISIVSNNSDNWYSENTARRTTGGPATVDRDRDGVDDRAEGAGTGAGIGATAGGVVGLLTGLGLLAIRASAPSLPPDGLWLQRLVLRLAARPVVSLVH
jgi:hypothetical protein